MIKLTKLEILTVAGGDDVAGCFCENYEGNFIHNDGFGADTIIELCKSACCLSLPTELYPCVSGSMPLYAGWHYNGTDPGIEIIEEPFEIVYKSKAGKC